MNKIKLIFGAAIGFLLMSGAVQAQTPDWKGFYWYNGLPVKITEGWVARADHCDIYICGEWNRIGNPETRGAGLPPHTTAAVGALPSADRDPVVCVWDIKVVTEGTDGSLREHIFRGFDFCTPEPSTIVFAQGPRNTYAVQNFKNAAGEDVRVTIPAAPMP